jgi:G3E family GTPase
VGYEGERERPLSDVLVDQVEFCDVLLLNKCDLVPEVELDRIEGVIRRLQPRAEVVRTTHCDVDADRVLDTGRFDLEAAQREVGWKRELAGGDHDHETLTAQPNASASTRSSIAPTGRSTPSSSTGRSRTSTVASSARRGSSGWPAATT